VRDPNGLFKGLPVKHVIADGESQSAFRLTTYVDAFQPKTKAYDGFLLHSRAGGAAPLGDNGPLTSTTSNPLIGPPLAKIRADNATPVLQLETESDVNAHILGFFNARQPDNGKLRTWELAGASHADAYALKLYGPQASALLPPCDKPMNAGYAQHYIVGSAFRALDTWTNWGQAPRSGQQLSTDANGAINRDANGIAKGGIRTWSVDVPISTETGEANSPAGFCSLFGTSTPFSADQIKKLYPTHQKYVDRVRLSTAFDGFLLSEDKKTVVDEANKSTIGN
jgi:hypothetical protein